jgi:LCP family protein required for cell wall assembly
MARVRPRSQRYRGKGAARVLTALLVVAFAAGLLSLPVASTVNFLRHTINLRDPVSTIRNQVAPPTGSVAWKLQHGQQVNLLVLGYGGQENDAPWLTDTIMAVSIDPTSRRVVETSIPRDLYVDIDAWPNGTSVINKVNVAFEVGNEPDVWGNGALAPQFQGKDGPGHLVEATIRRLTGLTFDRYVAVDFKAFRDVVDALGGIKVTLQGPLDDCHYPSAGDGFVNGGVPVGYDCPPGAGIHFPAGTYRVGGEQALEIARSRDAIEPDQATDFGRARRQQMVISGIRQQAGGAGALAKAAQLMDALQQDVQTDLDLADITALDDFGRSLKESAFVHLAVTDQNLLEEFQPYSGGGCGSIDAYALCPADPTYRTLHALFSHLLVDPGALAERATVQLVQANAPSADLPERLSSWLQPLGFDVTGSVQGQPRAETTVYDLSGGSYARTASWLASLFGGQVVEGPDPSPAPGEATTGVVVSVGTNYARQFYGIS